MSGPKHILLVEDNQDHAELVRRSLEHFPHLLHHVEDGEAALDYLLGRRSYADRAQFPAPQLVLLDLRLPRMDGIEVLKLAKSQPALAATPIVILTTSDAERDVAMAIAYHASGFLTKPVDSQRLGRLLQDLGFYGNAGQPARQPEHRTP